MEELRAFSFLKEAKFDYYTRYGEYIKAKCPFCSAKKSRTKFYHSLKSLTWHIAHDHSSDVGYSFSFEQVNEVLRALALAKEWQIIA